MSTPQPFGGDAAGDGQFSMQQMLQEAQQLQQQMFQAQEQLAQTQVSGSAGGGLVRATVSGVGELVGLVIEPQALHNADPETLADLVLAAVRDANAAAGELQQQVMGPLTAGLGG